MKRLYQIKLLFFRRSILIIAILLFVSISIIIWLLATQSSQSETSIVIGVAAVSALFGAISALATLLQAVEIQSQRESQERPYVIVDFVPASNGVIYLVIENFGNSPALDLSVKFDPIPIDYMGRLLNEVSLFQKPIRFLTPRNSIRQFVFVGPNLFTEGGPTYYKIFISYTSILGKLFQETVEIDLAHYKQTTRPPKSVEDHLESLNQSVEKLTKLFERVEGLGALQVESPEQHEARINRIENSTDS